MGDLGGLRAVSGVLADDLSHVGGVVGGRALVGSRGTSDERGGGSDGETHFDCVVGGFWLLVLKD